MIDLIETYAHEYTPRQNTERHYCGLVDGFRITCWSFPRGVSFCEVYGEDPKMVFRWEFNSSGRIRELALSVKTGNPRRIRLIKVYEKDPFWYWTIAIREFIPPETEMIFPRLRGIPYNMQYQHLIYFGHNIAHQLEERVGIEGGIGETELFSSEEQLTEIKSNQPALEIIHRVSGLFARAACIFPKMLQISYEPFKPQSPKEPSR
jgi:hypothetical protein